MKARSYHILTAIVVIILGAILGIGTVLGNALVPIIAFPITLLILIGAKSRVKEVCEDERNYHIARRAAHWAFTVFSITSAIVLNILIALGNRTGTLAYTVAGITLSLALVFLFLVYIAAYFLISHRS